MYNIRKASLVSKNKYLFKYFQRSLTSNKSNNGATTNSISIDKPLGTGSGPFVELPKFKTLGGSTNLLQIVIPESSSKLNVQTNSNSIISINENGIDFQFKKKYIEGGLEFQELSTSSSDLNLLVQGDTYKLLELGASDTNPWTVLNDENLVGWIDKYDKLTFKTVDILQKFKSLRIGGDGYVLINGVDDVLDLNLSENEEILVNPNALIATNSATKITYQLIPHGLFDLNWKDKLPSFSIDSLLSYGIWGNWGNSLKGWYKEVQGKYNSLVQLNHELIDLNKYVKAAIGGISKGYKYVYSKIFYNTEGLVLRRNPIFLKVRGPGRVILNNSEVVNNSKVLTNDEISKTI